MDEELIKLQTRCVSHEIRNHISICEMYSEIIKKYLEKDNYQNDSVGNAINCIQKSLKIISNSLLDLKSINNIEPKQCNSEDLIKEGVRLATAYIQNKNIKLDYFIKNSCTILVDENKFLACLVNIIKNGIEAIDDKGEINVISYVKDKFLHIKISNNGKMISKEKQSEIFKDGYTTKSTGRGLGLHICKSNLEAQKSTLRLNKSTKALTEFEIIVPKLVFD